MLCAKQFHFNFTILLGYIYCIHIMDNIANITMRLDMFFGIDGKKCLGDIFQLMLRIFIFLERKPDKKQQFKLIVF